MMVLPTSISTLDPGPLAQWFIWLDGDVFARERNLQPETGSEDPRADADRVVIEMAKRLIADGVDGVTGLDRTSVFNTFRRAHR